MSPAPLVAHLCKKMQSKLLAQNKTSDTADASVVPTHDNSRGNSTSALF